MKLAVYGKGGIGKSTVCANLSVSLAEGGRKVLQIGCDPKHDSTRLLLRSPQTTVLDQLRARPGVPDLQDMIMTGFSGVDCVEAGGPEPGVGCAGRGILATFEALRSAGLSLGDYDIVIYDVLGDVVCGGFAVPLRREHADAVMMVTSGEFMSIYAANNILRGVRTFDLDGPRVLGIVLNARGIEGEEERVERFAKAVGLPIIARIPRSELILQAEAEGQTVPEHAPRSEIAEKFRQLASLLTSSPKQYLANPLSDDELELAVLGRSTGHSRRETPREPQAQALKRTELPCTSQSVNSRSILFGCAMAGAASATVQIKDAMTLVHGPRSCGYIVRQNLQAAGRRAFEFRGKKLNGLLLPGLIISKMDEGQMVFGGSRELERMAREILDGGPQALFLLTTCASAIIGEDLAGMISSLSGDYPHVPIIPVPTDGNIAGDYMQGILNACAAVKALIDRDEVPVEGKVNIVGEKSLASNTNDNMLVVSAMLARLGQEVHCRFLFDTDTEKVRTFLRGGLSLPAFDDHFCWVLREMLSKEFKSKFLDRGFPFGLAETKEWLDELGRTLGREDEAKTLYGELEAEYWNSVERLRPHLQGRKLMLLTLNQEADWVVETAKDMGMDVVLYASMNELDYVRPFHPRRELRGVVRTFGYSPEDRKKDIRDLRPDLVLSTYAPQDMPTSCHYEILPLCPDVGHLSGIVKAERWAALMKAPLREGWRDAL